ncbi:Per1-like protein [Crassisporium funariophilum]|nr:Per1-like protein [Crassisporium funariophilum]
MRWSLLASVTLTVLPTLVHASSGDRSPEFADCVDRCQSAQCGPGYETSAPLSLRLTRWTCTDDCKYGCMHEITDRDIKRGKDVQQYHGKWPFWRLLGIQEPASVAFSLLNLWAHARGASKIRRKVSENHPMRSYYIVWSMASINAWVWSSVFHTRDLPITEKLDYFSAALAILYALYYTIIRIFHLYPPPAISRLTLSARPPKSRTRRNLTCVCIVAYLAHITYLTLLPRFDYTYNMAFNLVLGLVHNGLWALYALPASMSILWRFPSRSKSYRPNFVSQAGIFVLLTTAATGLELFDFPPWARMIDAHALWHLSTAPIALSWYDFLVEDSLDVSWREHKA